MKPVWAIVKRDGTIIPYWFLAWPEDAARLYKGTIIGPFRADVAAVTATIAPMPGVGWPLSVAYFDASLQP